MKAKYILFVFLCNVLVQKIAARSKYVKPEEDNPYEFGFTIDGQQHRHEKKDVNGIIQGEFGFITADGVYHVTVYATDENGNYKILSMKNVRISGPLDQPNSQLPDTSQFAKDTPKKTIAPVAPVAANPLSIEGPKIPVQSITSRPNEFTTRPTIKPACAGCGYVELNLTNNNNNNKLNFQTNAFNKQPSGNGFNNQQNTGSNYGNNNNNHQPGAGQSNANKPYQNGNQGGSQNNQGGNQYNQGGNKFNQGGNQFNQGGNQPNTPYNQAKETNGTPHDNTQTNPQDTAPNSQHTDSSPTQNPQLFTSPDNSNRKLPTSQSYFTTEATSKSINMPNVASTSLPIVTHSSSGSFSEAPLTLHSELNTPTLQPSSNALQNKPNIPNQTKDTNIPITQTSHARNQPDNSGGAFINKSPHKNIHEDTFAEYDRNAQRKNAASTPSSFNNAYTNSQNVHIPLVHTINSQDDVQGGFKNVGNTKTVQASSDGSVFNYGSDSNTFNKGQLEQFGNNAGISSPVTPSNNFETYDVKTLPGADLNNFNDGQSKQFGNNAGISSPVTPSNNFVTYDVKTLPGADLNNFNEGQPKQFGNNAGISSPVTPSNNFDTYDVKTLPGGTTPSGSFNQNNFGYAQADHTQLGGKNGQDYGLKNDGELFTSKPNILIGSKVEPINNSQLSGDGSPNIYTPVNFNPADIKGQTLHDSSFNQRGLETGSNSKDSIPSSKSVIHSNNGPSQTDFVDNSSLGLRKFDLNHAIELNTKNLSNINLYTSNDFAGKDRVSANPTRVNGPMNTALNAQTNKNYNPTQSFNAHPHLINPAQVEETDLMHPATVGSPKSINRDISNAFMGTTNTPMTNQGFPSGNNPPAHSANRGDALVNPLSLPDTSFTDRPPTGIVVSDSEIRVPNNPPIRIQDKYPNMVDGLPDGVSKDDVTGILYKFNYTVGFHGHYEKGYKNGAKVGGYFVTDRDGVSRVVTYVADELGYRPKVKLVRLDLTSDLVPKEGTEKTFGLKNFEFIWYPLD